MSTLFVNNLNTASGTTITIPTGKNNYQLILILVGYKFIQVATTFLIQPRITFSSTKIIQIQTIHFQLHQNMQTV